MHSELLARHRAVLPDWMALYYQEPISIVSGEGRYVTDAEGNQYLDFFGGILTTMTGYNIPEVVAAIKRQAGKMIHTSTLYMIESQIVLAERIAELSGIPNAKVFFTNSGSEANDAALMLATQYRRSNQVLAMRGSYHGRSHSTVGVTGQTAWSTTQFSPFHTVYIHGLSRNGSPLGHLDDERFTKACVDDLHDLLRTAVVGDVACLIAEPIQGVGGFVIPPAGFFAAIKKELDLHGILYISDEVQTGWGRTGEHFWGYEAEGIVPDVLTFAKGLGNGVPIAGVVARAEVMDAIDVSSISTFGGNPLSTAAALANLDYLLKHDLQTNSRKVGDHLMNGISSLAAEVPNIGEVRGKGLMIGVEFVEPGTKTPDTAISEAVMETAKSNGLLVGQGGLDGNVLRIAPPLSLTVDEADAGLELLVSAILRITKS